MHPLYNEAVAIADSLREVRLRAVALAAELGRAEYDLRVVQARVERALIKRVGNERSLAPTVEGRTRIFVLALDADADYVAGRKRADDLSERVQRDKVEAQALSDRLGVMLAAMRADDSD